jgi:anaerobic magnesium-protoporphyrin IX monomethyl ester cyclase
MAKVVLLTPARRFIVNRFGLGYQIPLGMVLLGGPLLDAGHEVWLIDNDVYGWSPARLVQEIEAFAPDCILLGHTGSTAAHDVCVATAVSLRAHFPHTKIAYGGVYPSYAADSILRDCPAIEAIVKGEGEETVLELVHAWEMGQPLAGVRGVVWRDGERVRHNPPRPPLQDLDVYRPGWELVDWAQYELFGFGRAAGMQFSRGCPLTCTYCGQWMFWKKWRHRSPANLVQELTTLAQEYGVNIVWLADENFGADREVTRELLNLLVEADLGLSLNVNMTAADVVRDADLLPLYKAAGVDYVVMGVESVEDAVITAVRKNNPFQISKQAVKLLRHNNILSFANVIYGLEDETMGKVVRKFSKFLQMDADNLNAEYITPHFWTKDGRATNPQHIIQMDMSKWTYRNQVTAVPHLSPLALFIVIKLTEGLYHLRPKALKRFFWGGDKRLRRLLRASLVAGTKVVLAEVAEFLFDTKFAPQGSMTRLPGTHKKSSEVCQTSEL